MGRPIWRKKALRQKDNTRRHEVDAAHRIHPRKN
jgi:hypothetical protein